MDAYRLGSTAATVLPYARLALSKRVRGDPGFEIDLDATRREAMGGNEPPEHGAMLRSLIRW